MVYLRTHDATSIAPPVSIKAGTIYTCPMHSQIRQVGPGNCPICGMTLEPVKATAKVGENRELVDMTRRFWVGLVLTLPVFVLEMGGHIPALGLHGLVPPRISPLIQFALSTPVVLSRIAGPGAGIARPRADRRRDPRLAQIGSKDSAPIES
jgi:Cu+-exporting ATPase